MICLKVVIEGDNIVSKIFDDVVYELSRFIIGLDYYFE